MINGVVNRDRLRHIRVSSVRCFDCVLSFQGVRDVINVTELFECRPAINAAFHHCKALSKVNSPFYFYKTTRFDFKDQQE